MGGAQLIRMGSIFRIVDDDEFAAHRGQRVIQRFGLRPWMRDRHPDDFELGGEVCGLEGGDGGVVVRLADQLDVEFGRRPVQLLQRRHELACDLGLFVERNENRIDRQHLAWLRAGGLAPSMSQGGGAKEKCGHVDQREGCMQ